MNFPTEENKQTKKNGGGTAHLLVDQYKFKMVDVNFRYPESYVSS